MVIVTDGGVAYIWELVQVPLSPCVTADENIDNNDTHFQFRQVLSIPATLKAGQIPNVTIAFGVSNAVGAASSTCTNAVMYAAEPSITITLD